MGVETEPDWGTFSPLSPSEYEDYFHQFRSTLPELDKKVITSIAVRRSSHLFATLTSLCPTRSTQDKHFDAWVGDANEIE